LDDQTFRDLMAHVPAPVTVVTTHDGAPHGTTVSAFASLSLSPKLVMVSMDNNSRILQRIRHVRRFGLAPNTRQMRWNSSWLATLAAQEPPGRYRRFTCFYGHCDNIVFPCSTATLPGADNRHLRGHAHVHMLRHPDVLAEVMKRLQD